MTNERLADYQLRILKECSTSEAVTVVLRELLAESAINRLVVERRRYVDRVTAIEMELASLGAIDRPADSPTSGRSLTRIEREIERVLAKGPLGARHIAKAAGAPFEAVQTSLRGLSARNRVTKLGVRGPSVRWQLNRQMSVDEQLRGRARGVALEGEFETVFPSRTNPKAAPAEVLGARA